MLGRVKLENILLTCDQGNFNQITERSKNRTLVTVVRDKCTINVSLAPQQSAIHFCVLLIVQLGNLYSNKLIYRYSYMHMCMYNNYNNNTLYLLIILELS